MNTTHFQQLYVFTDILIARARLASEGSRDSARDVLRYVRNARIVDILHPYDGKLLIDSRRLKWQLDELARDCHPLSFGRSTGDLYADILARLDLIAAHLGKEKPVQLVSERVEDAA